jgi:small-conductance mechanosensitive channel
MTKVAKVRAKARPWRSIISLVVALAAAGVAINWGSHAPHLTDADKAFTYGGSAGFFIFGMAAAFGLSSTAGSRLRPAIGQAHAGIVRYAVLLISLFILLVVALELVRLPIANLVVGGAVTGVLLGIAAQQSLANLFAGLVLLFAHPFRVGDHVRFRAGTLSGQIEGVIIDISLTYVRLETDEGQVLIPNSQALSAAVLLVQQVAPSDDPQSPSLV